jgi:formamidopyrimidine-DNA glycosylase
MPELPEVETIVRSLNSGCGSIKPITGKTVAKVKLLWKRTLSGGSILTLRKRLIGQSVQAVERRGKFVVIQFKEQYLLIHLRMSGDLRVESSIDEKGRPKPLQKHDRLVLEFRDGTRLAFNDTRKFGRAWLTKEPQEVLGKLGAEPLDPALTEAKFHRMITRCRRQLKPLLLDQTFLAGLGNIYVDEALFAARLHPLQNTSTLSEQQSGALLKAIRSVLRKAIRRNGASIDWVYRGGEFQNDFCVYQRDGQPCPVCGTTIERMLVGQRGTHYCPHCQRIG